MRTTIITVMLAILGDSILAAVSREPSVAPAVVVGTNSEVQLNELSGIAASQHTNGLYWVCDDYGGSPDAPVWAINEKGQIVEKFSISGVAMGDCEGVATLRDLVTGQAQVFIYENGQNGMPDRIVVINEPNAISPSQQSPEAHVSAARQIAIGLNLPNIEGLMADPISGDLFLVEKGVNARVYRLPYAAHRLGGSVTPQQVAQLVTALLPSSADISPDGSRILIRFDNGSTAPQTNLVWARWATQTVEQALSVNTPVGLPCRIETNGEAVCWRRDGLGFISTSELTGNTPQPVLYYAEPAKAMRCMRVDLGLFSPAYDNASANAILQLAGLIVTNAKNWGIDTIYAKAFHENLGSYWNSSSISDPPYINNASMGNQDLLKVLVQAAHGRGVKVIAWCQHVNEIRAAWDAEPLWREKTFGGSDYVVNPGTDGARYPLTVFNPAVTNWIGKVVREILGTGVDGVDIAECDFASDSGYDVTFDAFAVAAYGSVTPGSPAWHAVRIGVLTTNLYQMVGGICFTSNREYHVTYTWSAEQDGSLKAAENVAINTGFSFDQVLDLPLARRPDFIVAELPWQQWRDYYSGSGSVFSPAWTATAAADFLGRVAGRSKAVVHVEAGGMPLTTPTRIDFAKSLEKAVVTARRADFYDYSKVSASNWAASVAMAYRRRPVSWDFDGDGIADEAIYETTGWTNFILSSSAGNSYAQQFGWSNAALKRVDHDYDGDGITDLAIVYTGPSTGGLTNMTWYIRRSSGGLLIQQFGFSACIPVPGDYDGDARCDIAVCHQPSMTWYVDQSSNGSLIIQQYGGQNWLCVPADYDGDARTDIATVDPASFNWYIRQSAGGYRQEQFGWAGRRCVPADYDGDGKADIAICNQDLMDWYVKRSSSGSVWIQQFGGQSQTGRWFCVPADYDGDSLVDIGAFDQEPANWYELLSTSGLTVLQQFGWAASPPILEVPRR